LEQIYDIGKEITEIRKGHQCKNFTTDSNGEINYFTNMENVPKDIARLFIKATSLKYPKNPGRIMDGVEQINQVSLTFSNQNFSMSLRDKSREKIACGQALTATVFFASSEKQMVDVHYQAMAKGNIVASGTIQVDIGEESDAFEKLTAGGEELSAGDFKSNIESYYAVGNIDLNIDHTTSPSVSLVIYVNKGNETLTDSHTYEVGECQAHDVIVEWGQNEAKPGEDLVLSTKADKGALCALSAVDKSVELLGNDNKVDKKRLGQLQRDIGRRKEGYLPHYWDFERRCPVASKVLRKFEEKGMKAATNLPFMKNCQTLKDSINDEYVYEHHLDRDYVAYEYDYDEMDDPASVAGDTPQIFFRNNDYGRVIWC